MTRPRAGAYVWVTWLSRLMAGDIKCQWAPWFRTHYTDFSKAPSDFQLAGWTVEHTRLLDEVIREREALDEGVFKEDQNRFRVKRSSGLTISGKPDLIAVDAQGHATVYDVKTGVPRHSDVIQVMLYMMCLPYGSPLYKGKSLRGRVVYKSGERTNIPAKAIDKPFQDSVSYFLNLLESTEAPSKTPAPMECRFCDITAEDCSQRIELDEAALALVDDPEIPV